MTLPGGPAAKIGIRYEKWWTISEFIRMLDGRADSIRVEDPGFTKAEFVVTVGPRQEFHQAKSNHRDGQWTLARLSTKKDPLLQTIEKKLAGNRDRFIFVSGSDAPQLRSLCKASTDADSIDEFQRVFVASKGKRRSFDDLCRYWNCDVSTAFDRLRRISVHTIDERLLKNNIRSLIVARFLARPGPVMDRLRGIVEDSVHRRWTRQALIDHLADNGYLLRQLHDPDNAAVAVEETTNQYLSGVKRRLIQRESIPMSAAAELLSQILEGNATDSILTGKAGSGKTACVAQVVDRLRQQGFPVLSFRLDRISPSASTTADLGDRLNLEESPALVLAAAAEVTSRAGVLIVDQLDAVSTMSGRSSRAFDLVEQLLDEVSGLRARVLIRTVVVCRTFDWKNDAGLRRLVPDSNSKVETNGFTVGEVESILTKAGFNVDLFQRRQLELLCLPQNLSLFLESELDEAGTPTFDSSKDLFDRYWTVKRRMVWRQVTPPVAQWMEVMEILCRDMPSDQHLSFRREKLDKVSPEYLHQLASEGVLTLEGGRYGFGHESFFDYCFARLLIERTESLASLLKESEQHLFRRVQVRQVLAYLRDEDQERYASELRRVFSDPEIRIHIKDLAFALLTDVADPTEVEWTIWQEWIAPELDAIKLGTTSGNRLSALAWRRFYGSKTWFGFVDRCGMLADWLDSDNDQIIEMSVRYLRVHHYHSPDRVATILAPYAEAGDEWTLRLRSFMEWAELHTSRRMFDLFLSLIDSGTLDETRGPIAVNSSFWNMLYTLDKRRPEWVPEVVAHWLRRRVVIWKAEGGMERGIRLIDHDRTAKDVLMHSADRAPDALVRHVLPVVLAVSDSTLIDDDAPRRDAVWRTFLMSESPSGDAACLQAVAGALGTLAGDGNPEMMGIISQLRDRETYVANHLLLALYCGAPERYADEAAQLLSEEPWRFRCGYSGSPHWCAVELIRKTIRYCSDANREKLETAIMSYVSPNERTRYGYTQRGGAEFALLSAIPTELQSTRASARFQELRRKFREPQGKPREIAAHLVQSPIDEMAAAKMSDLQWLRAIAKYRSSRPIRHSGDRIQGSAPQLAHVLGARIKEEPERFARLSLIFPGKTNPVYMERVLGALQKSDIDYKLKLRVCRKAFTDAREECAMAIADFLGSSKESLPDEFLQMLHWLATEHEDPKEDTWQQHAGGFDGDIYANGINTVRGRVAEALTRLIAIDVAYVKRLRPTIDRMIRDPSAAVRSCIAGTLRTISHHDPELGILLFQRMNLVEDRLLTTLHVRRFLSERIWSNLDEIRPILVRMLRSEVPDVCEVGARLTSISSLLRETTRDLTEENMNGSAHHRLGVAQVAAANIAHPDYRNWCESRLVDLFNDENAKVRKEAASCFQSLEEEPLGAYEDLITTFCESRAFREDSFFLLHALERSRQQLPGMTCEICARFLHRFADEATDIRTGRFGDGHTITKLIFRTYRQHQNEAEWARRSLDLIDHLCLEGVGNVLQELEQFEQ